MCKLYKTIIFTVITVLLTSFTALASEEVVPVSELIDKGKEYNSQILTVKGEAVGELLERGEYSFLNINDGTSAMGIYLKTKDGEMVKYYGNYHNIGDTVRVKGVFNRACKEHGGDMDIHCNSMEIVSNGHGRTHDISKWKINIILVLSPFLFYGIIKVYGIIKNKKEKPNNIY